MARGNGSDKYLEAALWWAEWGLPVFQLRPGAKVPIKVKDPTTGRYPAEGEGGLHLATRDPDIIRAWWTKRPTANIGGRMGADVGVAAIDVDKAAQLNGLVLPDTREHSTPDAGRHLLVQHPGVHAPRDNTGKIAPDVDWMGDGSYIVLPPSWVAADPAKGKPAGTYRAVKRRRRAALAPTPPDVVARVQAGAPAAPDVTGDQPSRHLDDVTLAWKLVVNGVPEDVALDVLLARDRGRAEPLQTIGRRDEIVAAVRSAVRKLGEDPDAAEYEKGLREGRMRRRVKQTLDTEDLPPRVVLPAPGWSAVDELEAHREPPAPRIAGWCRAGYNILVSAREGAGKTTLGLNLGHSLLDGVPFLGVYQTLPYTGKLLYLNYEMSAELFDAWLRAMNIKALDRFIPVHLDGLALPFWLPDVRDEFAAYCRAEDIQGIVLDAAAKAYLGLVTSENDNVQVSTFTQALNVFKRAAGVQDAFLLTHMAKGEQEEGEETARGATAWGAWPEMVWTLTGRGEETRSLGLTKTRLLPGEEAVPTVALQFDSKTLHLRTSGQARKDDQEHEVAREVTFALVGARSAVINVAGGERPSDAALDAALKTKDLEALVPRRKDKVFTAGLRRAEQEGWLTRWFGSGRRRGQPVPLYDTDPVRKVAFPTPEGVALVREKVRLGGGAGGGV